MLDFLRTDVRKKSDAVITWKSWATGQARKMSDLILSSYFRITQMTKFKRHEQEETNRTLAQEALPHLEAQRNKPADRSQVHTGRGTRSLLLLNTTGVSTNKRQKTSPPHVLTRSYTRRENTPHGEAPTTTTKEPQRNFTGYKIPPWEGSIISRKDFWMGPEATETLMMTTVSKTCCAF